MRRKIKFIDLFAGIGGFHKALEIVAKENDYDIECVFISEIDKEAITTYTHNFKIGDKKIINIRDVDENASQVPNHDFLFAGFPCQTFSNAGNKKGFLDEIRGTLFFDIAKILKNKKPKYLLLENVKHLANHNNGETWRIIIKTLKDLGYLVNEEPLILSPHEFGIPQERQRVFILGVLIDFLDKKENKVENFNSDFLKKYFKETLFQNRNTVNFTEYNWEKYLQTDIDKNSKYFLKNSNKDKYLINVFNAWNEFLKNVKKPFNRTLPVIWLEEFGKDYCIENLVAWRKKYISDMRNVYLNNKEFIDKWMVKWNTKLWKKREQKFEWQAGVEVEDIKDSFVQLRQSGIRCRRQTKFPTLVAMVQIPIIYDKSHNEWRYLTPRETANLQSFPYEFKIYSDIVENAKDFYCYKQFGNSVNVHIVSKIQKFLLENY